MDLNLIVSSAELNSSQLQDITISLFSDINKVNNYNARLPKKLPQGEIKGEPMTLGVIIISIIKGGSLVAFLNLLRHYFLREPSLKIVVQKNDGTGYTLEQKNMSPEKIKEILTTLEEFMGN